MNNFSVNCRELKHIVSDKVQWRQTYWVKRDIKYKNCLIFKLSAPHKRCKNICINMICEARWENNPQINIWNTNIIFTSQQKRNGREWKLTLNAISRFFDNSLSLKNNLKLKKLYALNSRKSIYIFYLDMRLHWTLIKKNKKKKTSPSLSCSLSPFVCHSSRLMQKSIAL